jgi:adenosylmethionine-8-amino-7-oxononanoate aminotransferase
MSHVFPRVARELPMAVAAEGAWITDADGRRYLDAAGGAVVVGVGHGNRSLIEAAERQLARTQYVHGSMFTTEALEDTPMPWRRCCRWIAAASAR